jgi:hypothetical protein
LPGANLAGSQEWPAFLKDKNPETVKNISQREVSISLELPCRFFINATNVHQRLWKKMLGIETSSDTDVPVQPFQPTDTEKVTGSIPVSPTIL